MITVYEWTLERLENSERAAQALTGAEHVAELVPEQVTKMAEAIEEGKTIYGGMRWGKRWAQKMARAKPHQKALPQTAPNEAR